MNSKPIIHNSSSPNRLLELVQRLPNAVYSDSESDSESEGGRSFSDAGGDSPDSDQEMPVRPTTPINRPALAQAPPPVILRLDPRLLRNIGRSYRGCHRSARTRGETALRWVGACV